MNEYTVGEVARLSHVSVRTLRHYDEEAGQRWGNTDAWKQSQRRTAAYTKDDWIAIKSEADDNIRGFADALRAGEPATGTVAMNLAEAHHSIANPDVAHGIYAATHRRQPHSGCVIRGRV